MPTTLLQRLFPRLAGTNAKITSPEDVIYNCIAWAANNNTHWWEPDPNNICYWPPNVPRQYTMTAYIEAFSSIGYQETDNPNPEDGFEKIAIYATNNKPTHAARLKDNGAWTSKLGKLEDIEHPLPEHVGGTDYGEPEVYMKRPKST